MADQLQAERERFEAWFGDAINAADISAADMPAAVAGKLRAAMRANLSNLLSQPVTVMSDQPCHCIGVETGIRCSVGCDDPSPSQPSSVSITDEPHPPTRHCLCADCKPSFEELIHQAELSLDYRPEFRRAIANAHAALQSSPTAVSTGMERWAKAIHYPEHWDTACYQTLEEAITETLEWHGCAECFVARLSSPQEASKPQDERFMLYEFLKHGDEGHQAWLLEAIHAFFDNKPRPAALASQPSAASGREDLLFELRCLIEALESHDRDQRLANMLNAASIVKKARAALSAAPADANVGGLLSDSLEWVELLSNFAANPSLDTGGKLTDFADQRILQQDTPTAPEVSAPADKVDAERYRKLMSNVDNGFWGVCEFIVVDRMGATDQLWMEDKAQSDAAIDSMCSESAQGGKL